MGPVEQDRLLSEGEEDEKTSMGMSSLDMVASVQSSCKEEEGKTRGHDTREIRNKQSDHLTLVGSFSSL